MQRMGYFGPVRLTAVALAVSVLLGLHPQEIPVAGDFKRPALRALTLLHDDHTELEAIDLALAARTEREIRPLGAMPFDNSAMFPDPMQRPWQPQPLVFGSPIALLAAAAANGANDELPTAQLP